MTPAVALRRLWEQLDSYRKLTAKGVEIDVFQHFPGPISPPRSGKRPLVGDPVYVAVAEYISAVLGRAGAIGVASDQRRVDRYSRLLFTIEHALAIELEKVAAGMSMHDREAAAQITLSLASFWLDRTHLARLNAEAAHPLLGVRPADAFGKVLYDNAFEALSSLNNLPETVIDLRSSTATERENQGTS